MLQTVPRPVLVLGCLGVVPFLACAAAAWSAPDAWVGVAVTAEIAYGAVTLSALGAVHWGLAIAGYGAVHEMGALRWGRLAGGGAPALVAWAALAFLPPGLALIALMVAFAVLFMADMAVIRGGGAPQWYADVRKPLTMVVIVAMAATLFALPSP